MLGVLERLFESMDEEGFRYAVWKSLENLEEALEGVGDLDILFADEDRESVHRFMAEQDFVEDHGSPASIGDDLKVFRGFDGSTCRFIMIHAHFACRFGSKKFKEFRFPYETEMLDNACRCCNVKIIGDGYFTVTRILQATMKRSYHDDYVGELARGFGTLLSEQRSIVERHLCFYFDTDIPELMFLLGKGELRVLGDYYSQVYKRLDAQNSVSQYIQTAKRPRPIEESLRQTFWRLFRLRRNKLGIPVDLVIAGHDGTGKTSVSLYIEDKLKAVATTKRIYLGRNKWSLPIAALNRQREKRIFFFLLWLWPLCSTLEILARLVKGKLLKALGFVVIYDRSIVDLIHKYEKKKATVGWFPLMISRFAATREADLRYLLIADPTVAVERKGMHKCEEINDSRSRYLKICDGKFTIIDTSKMTVGEVASGIIGDIFRLCSK